MRKLLLPILALSFLMCGCPGPSKYARPQMPVPSAWPDNSNPQAGTPDAPAAASVEWKTFFTDQRLQSVIALALENNRDLRTAALNVGKVQALYRIQRAEQFPTVGLSGTGNLYRAPEGVISKDKAETVQQHIVGFASPSWELDLFGRIRSLKSRALEQYLATQQARSAAQISIVAAVANTYLALAADQESLRLAEDTLQIQQKSYDLIEQTRKYGMASDLELRQAESQVEAARVDIARYLGQIAVDENALNLLAGSAVARSMRPDSLSQAGAFRDIGPGTPSDVLLRRPDILMAEHQLKAADANIGAARAAFFPRIALTSGAGLLSSDLANLFQYEARSWSFAPQIGFPIFDSGARKAGYRAAEVDRDMAVAEYEKSIQSAFREVSDALSLQTSLADQQQALQKLVDTLQETYRLSEARYKGGIDSYLSVLIAQRSVYASQQQMLMVRLARLSNLVNLYKVLGGGA
jgi:outer membrane protein, multidrug efflux system